MSEDGRLASVFCSLSSARHSEVQGFGVAAAAAVLRRGGVVVDVPQWRVFFVRVNQVLVRLWARLWSRCLTGMRIPAWGAMAERPRTMSFRGVVCC